MVGREKKATFGNARTVRIGPGYLSVLCAVPHPEKCSSHRLSVMNTLLAEVMSNKNNISCILLEVIRLEMYVTSSCLLWNPGSASSATWL